MLSSVSKHLALSVNAQLNVQFLIGAVNTLVEVARLQPPSCDPPFVRLDLLNQILGDGFDLPLGTLWRIVHINGPASELLVMLIILLVRVVVPNYLTYISDVHDPSRLTEVFSARSFCWLLLQCWAIIDDFLREAVQVEIGC